MAQLHYSLVDVFTDRPFAGNQLAVFLEGRGLSTELMQMIAKEMNLSESTFVFPPKDAEHDYHVRIFTPGSELPMAGHPTIGTTFILAREKMIKPSGASGFIRLEEGVGTIPVEIEWSQGTANFIEMTQLLPKFGARHNKPSQVAEMLSLGDEDLMDSHLPLEVVSCGVPFLFVPLKSLDAIRRIKIRPDIWDQTLRSLNVTEVFAFTMEVENPRSHVHSRMFAPSLGIREDPATGAASGPLGCYLVRHKLVDASRNVEIVSEQGIEMGRPSFIRIRIEQAGGEISAVKVAGQCCFMGKGFLEIDLQDSPLP